MKQKVIIFVIGLLVGAALTAGCFLIYNNSKSSGRPDFSQNRGERPNMPENFDPENMPSGKPSDEDMKNFKDRQSKDNKNSSQEKKSDDKQNTVQEKPDNSSQNSSVSI